jgi:hypothetical protein
VVAFANASYWLGRQRDPLFVLRDPNAADFSVPELALPGDLPAGRLRAQGFAPDSFGRS